MLITAIYDASVCVWLRKWHGVITDQLSRRNDSVRVHEWQYMRIKFLGEQNLTINKSIMCYSRRVLMILNLILSNKGTTYVAYLANVFLSS